MEAYIHQTTEQLQEKLEGVDATLSPVGLGFNGGVKELNEICSACASKSVFNEPSSFLKIRPVVSHTILGNHAYF